MDGLCSAPSSSTQLGATDLAVSSADGRALQHPPSGKVARVEESCSILSGWTGFAAPWQLFKVDAIPILQYPQRMDGLCSVFLPPSVIVERNLQYPQRMDGLCSFSPLSQRSHVLRSLAVSSADGRAL